MSEQAVLAADSEVAAKATKSSWPLWKKLTLVGVALAVVIGLAVGLGVGLTRHKSSDDSDDDDSSSDSSNQDDESDAAPVNNTNMWKPSVGASWQIILKSPISLADSDSVADLEPDVGIWDLDLYDNNATTFAALRDAGKHVICYFSAGSWENWRDDAGDFDKRDLGKALDGWPGEKWLNISSPRVRKIMKTRIELASEKGCSAIDPDNVDGYQNKNGLGLTEADSISYMKFLSNTAARYNMSTGLKNAGDIIPSVLPYVHFSVNEQCIEYAECDTFAPFVAASKPVFNIEYPSGAPKVKASRKKTICGTTGDASGSERFSKAIKKMDLDGWVEYCGSDKTYTTETDSG